jgi:predicted ATPase
MIRTLSFRNFKCFAALDLELAPLTLLTGFNAGGKSTTIQTLLLLEQTLKGPISYPCLMLNGPILNLGTATDVLYAAGSSKAMVIGVTSGDHTVRWQFAAKDRLLAIDEVEEIDGVRRSTYSSADLIGIRPQGSSKGPVLASLESIVYLSAARQVDTEVYPSAFGAGLPKGDVGSIGQYASWWLHEEGDDEAPASRRHPGFPAREAIRQQVNAWMGDLFPGAEANSRPIDRTNLVRLEFRSGLTSDWVRPSNIGYGMSYAFPIIVAGLCAEKGQTVILDSPEAHLHPRAQSRVGRFLAQMAGAGAQTVIETHSDHLLNGVRIAVRDGLLSSEEAAIYFFTGNKNAQVIRLSVDKNGTISGLPEGFFDQAERDLADLAGWDS